MVKIYIIGIKSDLNTFLERDLSTVVLERIRNYELDRLKIFLKHNFKRISKEEVIELRLKYTYDFRPDDRDYYEKELEEFGSGINYYLLNNLSKDKSFIEEALVQEKIFIEDRMEEKGIAYFELD